MIREAHVSLQSFTLGLGVLSYLLASCGGLGVVGTWLGHHLWPYCGVFFLTVNLVVVTVYRGADWQVAVRGCFLGTCCGGGILVSVLSPTSYNIYGWYVVVLTIFHFSEYLTTAIGNPKSLSLDSYLLNHSWSYGIAAVSSWTEFFIERWLLPDIKMIWYVSFIGIIICLWGEIIRKSAMLTAKTNFNHIVQVQRQEGHQLVTWGAYKLFRHPSYVGWFWWSIGTQVILVNPLCTIAYALASWTFFNDRIHYEERTLINFFGEKYLVYQKKVGTGLPFIKGFVPKAPQNEAAEIILDEHNLNRHIQSRPKA